MFFKGCRLMTKHTVLQDKKLSTAQINDGEWQAEHFLGI